MNVIVLLKPSKADLRNPSRLGRDQRTAAFAATAVPGTDITP